MNTTTEPASEPIDHSQCVPARWGHRTHNHEGVAGAWLFPSEAPPAPAPAPEGG